MISYPDLPRPREREISLFSVKQSEIWVRDYSGHCRDLKLVSSLARVRNSESLFQSIICNFFTGDLAAVRIIGVSIIAGCPQGESWLWLLTVLYGIVPWDYYRFFLWLLPGRAGRWVKFRFQNKPILQFITDWTRMGSWLNPVSHLTANSPMTCSNTLFL